MTIGIDLYYFYPRFSLSVWWKSYWNSR